MATVFVASLHFDLVDDSALYQFFSGFVEVRYAKIVRDASGASKGFGFVELLHDEDLPVALELDGYEFHGRRIGVALAKEHR